MSQDRGPWLAQAFGLGGAVDQFEYKVNCDAHTYSVHEAIAAEWGGCIVSITDQEEMDHLQSLHPGEKFLTGAKRTRAGLTRSKHRSITRLKLVA